MEKEVRVDARGKDCPEPVILTKKMLDGLECGVVVTLVDSPIARENVVRLAQSQNLSVQVQEHGGDYMVRIEKGAAAARAVEMVTGLDTEGKVFLIGSETLGQGPPELGLVLMRNFLLTLSESEAAPCALLFVNSGVKLCCQGSPAVEYLMMLCSHGVQVMACGTCLNFFGLRDRLMVGEVTNMYTIVEYISGQRPVITL